ncbi:hypothetical protein WOLCODRAFT_144659 [Wolfiporia cocos MD-104 SS10]|uniref:DUF1279 domain-containing protein n=1 Tax=Wolfiporia cocos (strain MD-104) TaxID=742152 RepID=A0A2H3JNH9_WOLCO|nr:hypothetical protein WOLCODRAFT_144659 [Wolfiporia cocos MD-104 SS10]
MVRNLVLRFPLVRALLPRVAQPILPLTRLAPASLSSSSARSSTSPRLFHHIPARLTSSPPPSPSRSSSDPNSDLPPDATLSQRLKHLIKSYGWYALGVYVLISTVDLTVAFAGINLIGAAHVARATAAAKEFVTSLVHSRGPEPGREEMESMSAHASAGSAGHEGFYAMLVLAYTVHKTLFLPVRVGLTAALTPRLVRWLRARGWAGGEGAKRAAREMRDRMRRDKE